MKIRFKKSKLLEKLYPCMGTVTNKDSVPAVAGVLIETMGGNTVRLSTYDMNKGVRVTLEAEEVIEPGSNIIAASRLLQIIKVLSEDELTISVDENLNTTVSSGKASFSLSALPGKDFPTMPELSGPRGFEVESSILKEMISKIIHSVAEQNSRPMLCGAYFRIMQNKMELVSCDMYTLSRRSVVCDLRDVGEVSVMDFSFIVPGHALNELVRILGDGDEITCVMIARKHAIFFFNDIIFFTRMIDSEYIDYERIIPKGQTIHITVERDRMLAALERATLIAEERIAGTGRNYVKLILDGDVMSITSVSVNGKVYDEMPITHEGEDLEIGFNCRYLINSIRASEGEMLDLYFQSATQGVTIHPHEVSEEKNFFYMVLPVRMNG